MNPASLNNFGWSDPAIVAKRKAAIKATWNRGPEMLENLRAAVKASWTPERKAKHAEMQRQRARAKLKNDDKAFTAKLKHEGFTPEEIASLLTTGRVGHDT
jgi:hypothetical protein